MSFITGFVCRRPWVVIAAVIAITCISILGTMRIRVSSGLREFYAQTDPQIKSMDLIEETFGGSEYIMIAFPSEQVFTVRGLRALSALSEGLEEIEGIARVRSITNIAEVTGTPWGLEVSQTLEDMPETEEEAEAFRVRIEESSEISGALLSGDGDHVLTLVGLSPGADAGRVAKSVQEATGRLAPDFSPHYAGGPVLAGAADEFLKTDIKKLLPVCTIVIVVVLFASFRTVAGVVLPLATVMLSVVWTMGLMGFADIPFTQITSALPVVLLATGSAYGIHIMHRYYENHASGADGSSAASSAVESVGVAIVLAGITTIAGYGSNAASSVVRIREFGLLAGFGVSAGLVIALTFVPAVLSIFRPAPRKVALEGSGCPGGGCPPVVARIGRYGSTVNDSSDCASKEHPVGAGEVERSWRDSLFAALSRLVARRGWATGLIAAALAVFALAGVARIQVDTSPVTFFPSDSVERRDFDLIRSEFGGVDTVQIMVGGDILDPKTLSAIERVHGEFESVGGYGRALSIVNVLKQASRALHDNDKAWERLPSTRKEAAQYVLLVSMSGDVGLDEMITIDNRKARIEVMADTVDNSTNKASRLQSAVEIVKANLSGVSTISSLSITGMPFLEQSMGEMVMSSQKMSLLFAAIAVAFIVYMSFGRSWDSFLCLLPVALTILANFGMMGWAKISLNLATALVSSIAVGIGIDYSVHVYSRFRQGIMEGYSPEDAMRATIANTGRAVALNALAVAAGFAVMLLSEFPPLQQFGALIALTMAVSAGGALTILPASLLAVARRRSLAP